MSSCRNLYVHQIQYFGCIFQQRSPNLSLKMQRLFLVLNNNNRVSAADTKSLTTEKT